MKTLIPIKAAIILAAMIFFLFSCNNFEESPESSDLLDQELSRTLKKSSPYLAESVHLLPESDDYANIPQDPNNPLTKAKVRLGMFLFHESGTGREPMYPDIGYETFSCATCHHFQGGFQANIRQGLGEGGMGFGITGESRRHDPRYAVEKIDVQPVRSPSILNVAYQTVSLWNGQFGATGLNEGTEQFWTPGTPKETNFLGYHGPETQAIAGMEVHRLLADMDFCSDYKDYEEMFMEAYPGLGPEIIMTREYAGLAIAAYERTVLSNRAPFQRWLRGDNSALTSAQKNGANLFFGKAKCIVCHTGPALAKNEFHAYGMGDLEGPGIIITPDASVAARGRGGFTNNPDDEYKFKVPQLYNLKDSPFYGHGATFTSVYDVIKYKNKAIKQNPNVPDSQLSEHFKPLNLTREEMLDMADFIENALHDPYLNRYVPEMLPTGKCIPNNDYQSQIDLGCIEPPTPDIASRMR